MLPALLLRDKPAAQPTYTRRPLWSQPFESLWGILSKWQFVNCLAYSTLARCVSSLSPAEIYQGLDLRALGGFDLDALDHYTGVPRASLARGACSASADSPGIALASIHLRFCPSCIHDGYHATLFQFTPITRCPIHDARLIDACPNCGAQIPYRLDAAFAANPLACPHCLRSLLADPTVLMRADFSTTKFDTILRWQLLLAKYAYWYPAVGPRARANGNGLAMRNTHAATNLAFIGKLQDVMREPPLIQSIASRRSVAAPCPKHQPVAAVDRSWQKSFANGCWPHFQSKIFVCLCHLYAQFHDDHQRHDSVRDRRITHWWRRTWDGAIARQISASISFEVPPFGVAEWVAFSPPQNPTLSPRAAQNSLILHFEEDLQLTWDTWSGLLSQVVKKSHAKLHPRLVPPRSCWLNEPLTHPEAPVLGLF